VSERIAGRYEIGDRLGYGGMSTVHLAFDGRLERQVAVKLLAEHLADDDQFVSRFRREALAAARLVHPNIVQVFDFGLDEPSGRHYIVMEYIKGRSGAELLRDAGPSHPLDVSEAAFIVDQSCRGLEHAHRHGLIHRDVKPGNLLRSEEGAVKLADFGIAKAGDAVSRITQVGSVLGTAAYLSPEQAHGDEAGPRSDTYSLGVCAYQLLTGRLPHEYGSLTELALKQRNEPVEPISELRPAVPLALDLAIRVSLERDPADRYETALDFARALEAGLHGQETEATRRLAAAPAADPDATRALGDVTDATRALRTRQRPPVAPLPLVNGEHGREVAPAAAQAKAKRNARNRRWGQFLVLIAVLMAIAAVALVLLSSGGGDGGIAPVDGDDVQQQIDGIEQFLRDNTQP
jgi:eukaryotic-like serine/threonine-protein kinase